MPEQFTVEEVNLMCIFDISSRDALIGGLTAAIPDFGESAQDGLAELIEIAENVLSKLAAMSDADFSVLGLYPEYNEESEV